MRLNKIIRLLGSWYQYLEVYRTKKANAKFEKSVNNAFNQREEAFRILEDGALELTNMRVERAVKEIVMCYSLRTEKRQEQMQSTNQSS